MTNGYFLSHNDGPTMGFDNGWSIRVRWSSDYKASASASAPEQMARPYGWYATSAEVDVYRDGVGLELGSSAGWNSAEAVARLMSCVARFSARTTIEDATRRAIRALR